MRLTLGVLALALLVGAEAFVMTAAVLVPAALLLKIAFGARLAFIASGLVGAGAGVWMGRNAAINGF